jgi:hypothetical protein
MDLDADLQLRPEFEEKLHQAVAYVAAGGRLLSMEELTGHLKGAEGVVGVGDDTGGQRKAQRMKNG